MSHSILNWPVSHVGPVYCGRHWQSGSSAFSWQRPPFWQGFLPTHCSPKQEHHGSHAYMYLHFINEVRVRSFNSVFTSCVFCISLVAAGLSWRCSLTCFTGSASVVSSALAQQFSVICLYTRGAVPARVARHTPQLCSKTTYDPIKCLLFQQLGVKLAECQSMYTGANTSAIAPVSHVGPV